MTIPACPRCNTAKHARTNGHRLFLCTRCGGLYDDSGDDGATPYGDPSRIAERNERLTKFAKECRRNAGLPNRGEPRLRGGLG